MSLPPLWTAAFFRVTAIQFLTFLAFLMITPVLPVYLSGFTRHEGVIGAAVGVFTLSAVAVRLWIGPVLDRHGRRAVLLDALVWFGLASALYAAANSAATVFAVRMLHGAAFGAATTATGAMAADVVPAARRAEGIAYFGASVNVAQAVGPIVGFAAAGRWGFDAAFLTGALMTAVALALVRAQGETAEPAGPEDSGAGSGRRNGFERAALVPSALMFTVSLAFGGVVGLIPLYATRLGMANPGPFFTALAAAVVLVRPLAGRIADRFGALPLTAAGLVATGLAVYVIGSWPPAHRLWGMPAGILIGAVLFGLGQGSVTPVAQAVSIARAPRSRWGAASATFFAALDLGIGVGAVALGTVAEWIGLSAMYRWSALLPAAGLALLAATRQHWSLAEPAEVKTS